MQFLIIGRDGLDEQAMERRMSATPDHIAMGDKLSEAGKLWYGAALRDDNNQMIGSKYLMDSPSLLDSLIEPKIVASFKTAGDKEFV